MRFLTFIRHNLFRQKVRSLLTSVGVAVSIAAVVTLVSSSTGFKNAMSGSLQANNIDMIVNRAGATDPTTSSLDESLAARLRELPGIARVEPYMTEAITEEGAGVLGITFKGYAPDSQLIKDLKVIEGKHLEPGDDHGVMIGKLLSSSLKKKVGEKLKLQQDEFTIVGVYDSTSILENGQAVLHLSDIQRVLDRPGQVTGFQIIFAQDQPNNDNKEATAKRLKAQINGLKDAEGKTLGLSALPTSDFVKSDMQVKLAGAMAWGTSVIALVIGTIGILNTMVMSVLERTREIGILRAIGWRKSRVMGMIMLESMLLSILGWVLGVCGAYALTIILAGNPRASRFVRYDISLTVIGVGFGVCVLVALVGGAYPAFRGANLKPTEALHHE